MPLSNLRKSIFFLEEAIRKDKENSRELLQALDIMVKIERKNLDVNDSEDYNLNEE